MSSLTIRQKRKSPDITPTPSIPTEQLQQLPKTIGAHISSFLTYTPRTVPQLVSKSWAQLLPIQHLDFSNTDISDDDLISATKNCQDTLTSINLHNCHNLTDKSIAYLATFKNLKSLNLNGNNRITGQGFKTAAPQHWSLSDLFSWMGITEKAQPLVPFPQLKELNIKGCQQVVLQDLPTSLTSLSLNQRDVIGEGLAGISRFENLTSLEINGTYATTNQDMMHLSHLPNLTTLRLIKGNLINDEGLVHLAPLERLTQLDLVDCPYISDEGIQQLRNLRQPRHYRENVLEYFKQSAFLIDDLHPLIGSYLSLPDLNVKVYRTVPSAPPVTNWWEER